MKTLLNCIMVVLFISTGVCMHAQINTSANTKAKYSPSKSLGVKNNIIPTISAKSNIKSTMAATHSSRVKKTPPKLSISKKDLERNSRNRVKITPKKPIHTHLKLQYFGEYSPEFFVLNQRPLNDEGELPKYSGFIKFNAVKGREYRLKILTRTSPYRSIRGATWKGTVLMEVGGHEYSAEISERSRVINLFFKAEIGGFVTIALSPLKIDDEEDETVETSENNGIQHNFLLGHMVGPQSLCAASSTYKPAKDTYLPLGIHYVQIEEI